MSVLSDVTLADHITYTVNIPMIAPFNPSQTRKIEGRKVISSGLSSCGYDVSLSLEGFKIFSPINASEIDPKAFNSDSLISATPSVAVDGSVYWLLPPHSYALGVTVEGFNLPPDVAGICMGKSTYARCGLLVNCTPLEPGWSGRLVLELGNLTQLPIRVYAGEGIAQVMFFELDRSCGTSYADRAGKYQGQSGITEAKV